MLFIYCFLKYVLEVLNDAMKIFPGNTPDEYDVRQTYKYIPFFFFFFFLSIRSLVSIYTEFFVCARNGYKTI